MSLHSKVLELRDRNTFIPILATLMRTSTEPASYYLRRCGYSSDKMTVLLCRLDGTGMVKCDPYAWGDRTFRVAHDWIEDHWDEIGDGSVVDVEFILGDNAKPKVSERFEVYGGGPGDPAMLRPPKVSRRKRGPKLTP